MKCKFCDGRGKVSRVRPGLLPNAAINVDVMTCPACIRGITTLGTHEMLRDARGGTHQQGERLERRLIARAFGVPEELLGE